MGEQDEAAALAARLLGYGSLDEPWPEDLAHAISLISDALRAARAEGETKANAYWEGEEGRCSQGHNRRFTYELEGRIGCVACERDEAREKATREALERACRDVCMYCGERAVGYAHAQGPNAAGNYVHYRANTNENPALCVASAIHVRLRALIPAPSPAPSGSERE